MSKSYGATEGALPFKYHGSGQAQRLYEDSMNVIHQTEDIGKNVESDLHEQREGIESARGMVNEMGEYAKDAKETLDKIQRRQKLERAILYGIIGVEIFVIIAILYHMLGPSGSTSSS
ncbi:unnamed protein product [Heterosigma akashiwo]|mmetsp:Transcript_46211/g.67514  ORF Transcript_46211/g.67514 Transcript_46211/m.67514 type:complete len:118 (-) Transcript_46211:294-647(-)